MIDRSLKYSTTENDIFFINLKDEVCKTLGKNYHRKANKILALKGAILLLVFGIGLFSIWSIQLPMTVYFVIMILLGTICLPLILNIGHEAVHRNLSKKRKWNKLGKGVFFLLGTSSYFWELRHNASHHAFTNVKDLDLDIEQSKIIRLSSKQRFSNHHNYQHYYMPIAFALYTLVWFFIRDFKDLGRKRFGSKFIKKHSSREISKLFIAKVWHICFLLVIPLLANNMLTVVLGFFVFHISASLATTLALISTHVGENQEIIHATKEGRLPYSWAEHQLRTTADFSTNNTFALHFFGGFNHHVAHHLFPNIPHVLYPKITPLIRKHAAINGLPYYHYPNLFTCIRSHFRRLEGLSNEI